MKRAKLIEINEENKVHDLTALLSKESKVVIGIRNPDSAVQPDICLGEDEKGKMIFPILMKDISGMQAVITYEDGEYCLQDCSARGTTRINDECLYKGEKRILDVGVKISFGRYKYGPLTFWREI